MSSANYLGQLVPITNIPHLQYLSMPKAKEIKDQIHGLGGIRGLKVEVLVTSKNGLKMQAAKESIEEWIYSLFNEKKEVVVTGFGVPSGIDEQPHGMDHTMSGAVNRLKNMKVELINNGGITSETRDGVLRILVSLENGLIPEEVYDLKNPQIFKTENGTVWVDRCVEVGEIWLNGKTLTFGAISEGVTTPKDEVKASETSNWSQTAGSFISKKYGWNSADWHGSIAGKGRKIIMEELAKAGLGLPYTIPIPTKIREFHPSKDTSRYLQYMAENVQVFSSKEIEEMLAVEIAMHKNRSSSDAMELDNIEESALWRKYYETQIPQPSKVGAHGLAPVLGPDNKTPLYSSGPILTEDLMVGYFDEVEHPSLEKKDVLHIVLLWADEGGWVLPGKRDRAYDSKKADISVKDANYSLVEKEIGVDRSEISYHFTLSYFDDRKREQRMKSSGFLSFVLLDQKPQLDGRRIGVPLNALVQLVQGEITIPPVPEYSLSGVRGVMARNHDSLIINVFKTAAFYQAMEKVKYAQAKFRELLRTNPRAVRPALSGIDVGFECSVCLDLQIRATLICENGHSLCGICLPAILNANNGCPECRKPIFARPIPNRALETIIQQQYPVKYAERHKELTGAEPRSWKDDPAFIGTHIHYKS